MKTKCTFFAVLTALILSSCCGGGSASCDIKLDISGEPQEQSDLVDCDARGPVKSITYIEKGEKFVFNKQGMIVEKYRQKGYGEDRKWEIDSKFTYDESGTKVVAMENYYTEWGGSVITTKYIKRADGKYVEVDSPEAKEKVEPEKSLLEQCRVKGINYMRKNNLRQLSLSFNADGRLEEEEMIGISIEGMEERAITEYEYDGDNLLLINVERYEQRPVVIDQELKFVSMLVSMSMDEYTLNEQGDPIKITTSDEYGVIGVQEFKYAYDNNGNWTMKNEDKSTLRTIEYFPK